MLFDWFRAIRANRRQSGERLSALVIAESAEQRIYFAVVPTKLVFISTPAIIVAPGDPIDTYTGHSVNGNPAYGILIQQQTAAGAGVPASQFNPGAVTITLTSSTVSNPVFADGSSTEMMSLADSVAPGSAFFQASTNLAILVAGNYTLTASDPQGLFTSTPIEVTAPSAANSLILTPQPTVTAGTAIDFAFQPEDSFGNVFNTTLSNVQWSLIPGSGTSQGTFGATVAESIKYPYGTDLIGFYGTVAGTPTQVGVVADGTTITSPAPTIQVEAGVPVPSKSLVTVGQPIVQAGNVDAITLHGKDINGLDVNTGGATVVFSVLTSTGTSFGLISATADNGDGTYTANFTATTAGTPVKISATINGMVVTTVLPTIKVTPGSVSPVMSTVSVAKSTLINGTTETLTFQAKDQFGNNLTTGGATVVFSVVPNSGTSNGTVSTAADDGNGTYTAVFTATTAGTPISIDASVDGTLIAQMPLPTIQVMSESPAPSLSTIMVGQPVLVAGATETVTLQAKDIAGNNLTTGGDTVVFQVDGGPGTSFGTFGTTTDNGNGTYSATFTATTTGKPVKIGALVDGVAVTTTLPTIQVTPGTISPVTSVVSVSPATLQTGNVSVITLQAKDAEGNNLITGGDIVTFAIVAGSGTSTGMISPIADNGNGTYTAAFTATGVGTAIQIQATVDGMTVAAPLPTIRVVPNAASPAESFVTVASPTVVAGAPDTITLQAVDATGADLTTGGLAVVFSVLTSQGSSTGLIGPVTDNGNGTYSATFTGVKSGTPVSIAATINSTQLSTKYPTITVTTGPIDPKNATLTVRDSQIISGFVTIVKVQTKDIEGNDLTAGGDSVVISTTGSGTSTGTLGNVIDNGDGTYTAQFTGGTPGTAIKFAATVDGITVTTPEPSITVIPGAIDAANSLVFTSPVVVGQNAKITLQTRDSLGNDLIKGGSTVVFSLSGALNQTLGVTDNKNGTYTASFNSVLLGTIQISATVDGTNVPPITVTVSPVAPGFVFPTGFYYKPGRVMPLKIFNLSKTVVQGPFSVSLGLTDHLDGTNAVSVVGGGGILKGSIPPGQSRTVPVRLGQFPAGYIPYDHEAFLVAAITTPQFVSDGVSASPVLTPPDLKFVPLGKTRRARQGQLLTLNLPFTNKGFTGPGAITLFFTGVTLSGSEQTVYKGDKTQSPFTFTVQPVGANLGYKVLSGGFGGKLSHGRARLRFVVPAVVSSQVSVTIAYSDANNTLSTNTSALVTLDIK